MGCNISSNMNCCQEVKQRTAMAKEAFNRKRSIFCGPLELELRERLVKCFAWSVALYDAETSTLRRNEQKRLEAFEMCIWRRMERVKWTDKIKKCSCAGKSGRRKHNAGNNKKRERNLLGHWLRRNCLLEDALRRTVNGKKVRSVRRYQMADNIMINGLYEDTRKEG